MGLIKVMKTPEASDSSAVDRVVSAIRSSIEYGRYCAGQRLPEVDLCLELGVSRPVLREALAQLRADGIVDQQRFRGNAIRRLLTEDVFEILRICSVFEGLVAADAATNIVQPAKRRSFEKAVERFHEGQPATSAEIFDTVRALQNAIGELADNAHLVRLSLRIHNPLLRQFYIQLEPNRVLTIDQIRRLARPAIDAILGGEPERAETLMRKWIEGERAIIAKIAADRLAPVTKVKKTSKKAQAEPA